MSSSTTITSITTTTSTSIIPNSSPVSPAAVGQGSNTSTTTSTSSDLSLAASIRSSPLSSVSKPTVLASPSRSSQEVRSLTSTANFYGSTSSSPTSTPQPSSSALPNHRLSNSTVAGTVVGAALSLAVITFLATFAIVHRQRQSKSRKRSRFSEDGREVALDPPRQQVSTGVSRTYDSHLPQPADDRTIQQKVRSTMDQIELHVESFYHNSSSPAPGPDNRELAVFDSPYLSASLASLLPQSRNKLNIMKHALLQSITSALSPTAHATRSLIPTEYTLLPNTIALTKSSVTLKPGKYHLPQMEIRCSYYVVNSTKNSPR